MNDLTGILEAALQKNSDIEECLSIIRLKTSYWKDKAGSIHCKKTLTPLKRLSKGYQILGEDCDNIGADEVFPRIINVDECKDGIYKVITCNEHRDWESGYIEDYDYQLIKYEAEKSNVVKQ